MPAPEIQEIRNDGETCYLYATNPSWVFGLEDGEQRQFGLFIEILDMFEATGEEEFEDFPINVEISIVAHKPSPEFAEVNGWDGLDPEDTLAMIECAYSYCGGVPVSHILQDEISREGDKGLAGTLRGIDPRGYKIVEKKAEFGTVAAQRGPNYVFSYPRFQDHDNMADARQHVANLLERASALGMMIGFILDRPINMAGHSGWSTMTTWVYGPNC